MDKHGFHKFDAALFLDSEDAINFYIEDILEDNNPELLLCALQDVIRARSISQLSAKTGIDRKKLFELFRPGSNPSYELIEKIASALDIDLKKFQDSKISQTEPVG